VKVLLFGDKNGRDRGVARSQLDVIPVKVNAFDRGFSIDERYHDLAVLRGALPLDDHHVPIVDTALDHGVAPYLEGNVLPPSEHLFRNIDVLLDLVHFKGPPRSHGPYKGDTHAPFPEIDHLERALLVRPTLRDVPLFLEGPDVVEHRADRFEAEVAFDLLVGRCDSVPVDVLSDEPVDPLLFLREIHDPLPDATKPHSRLK
jgi:hypothetical protein